MNSNSVTGAVGVFYDPDTFYHAWKGNEKCGCPRTEADEILYDPNRGFREFRQ